MPYHQCPDCGQKALSVATRCPRCGVAFEDQFVGHRESGAKHSRVPLTLVATGVAAAILVASTLLHKPGVTPPARLPGTARDSAPPAAPLPRPLTKPLGAAAETAPPASPAPTLVPRESPAPPADRAGLAAATRTTEPVATAQAQRRYASTWTNVRADRSGTAPVLRILRPGEPVRVDSLDRGWYRVVAEGHASGYVDRRYLDTSPPQASP
jgi:hypothetical protein